MALRDELIQKAVQDVFNEGLWEDMLIKTYSEEDGTIVVDFTELDTFIMKSEDREIWIQKFGWGAVFNAATKGVPLAFKYGNQLVRHPKETVRAVVAAGRTPEGIIATLRSPAKTKVVLDKVRNTSAKDILAGSNRTLEAVTGVNIARGLAPTSRGARIVGGIKNLFGRGSRSTTRTGPGEGLAGTRPTGTAAQNIMGQGGRTVATQTGRAAGKRSVQRGVQEGSEEALERAAAAGYNVSPRVVQAAKNAQILREGGTLARGTVGRATAKAGQSLPGRAVRAVGRAADPRRVYGTAGGRFAPSAATRAGTMAGRSRMGQIGLGARRALYPWEVYETASFLSGGKLPSSFSLIGRRGGSEEAGDEEAYQARMGGVKSRDQGKGINAQGLSARQVQAIKNPPKDVKEADEQAFQRYLYDYELDPYVYGAGKVERIQTDKNVPATRIPSITGIKKPTLKQKIAQGKWMEGAGKSGLAPVIPGGADKVERQIKEGTEAQKKHDKQVAERIKQQQAQAVRDPNVPQFMGRPVGSAHVQQMNPDYKVTAQKIFKQEDIHNIVKEAVFNSTMPELSSTSMPTTAAEMPVTVFNESVRSLQDQNLPPVNTKPKESKDDAEYVTEGVMKKLMKAPASQAASKQDVAQLRSLMQAKKPEGTGRHLIDQPMQDDGGMREAQDVGKHWLDQLVWGYGSDMVDKYSRDKREKWIRDLEFHPETGMPIDAKTGEQMTPDQVQSSLTTFLSENPEYNKGQNGSQQPVRQIIPMPREG